MILSLSLKQFPLLYVQLCIFCSPDVLLQTALRIRVGMKQQTWAVTQNSYKTITQAALERKRKIHIKSIRGDFGQQEWKTSSCGWVWDAYQSLVQHDAFSWHALWCTYKTGKAAGRAHVNHSSLCLQFEPCWSTPPDDFDDLTQWLCFLRVSNQISEYSVEMNFKWYSFSSFQCKTVQVPFFFLFFFLFFYLLAQQQQSLPLGTYFN